MPAGSEQLHIVLENPDGTLEWGPHGPLSAPGAGGPAVLANLALSGVLSATAFEVTESGDWLASCGGMTYNVLPGIIPETGQFVFVGVPTSGRPNPRRADPPVTRIEARRAARPAAVPSADG